MQRLHSLLKERAAVLTSLVMVLAVIAMTASGFLVGDGNARTAYAETQEEKNITDSVIDEQNFASSVLTEAKIRSSLTSMNTHQNGRLSVGGALVENILEEQEKQDAIKAENEKTKEELKKIQDEKDRLAAEEAARKAKIEAEAAAQKAEFEARKAASVISFTENDYEVLLRIVQAEAGICDEVGRVMVANVIMNRVRDDEFPDNITDVVYQRSQFSPVSNGQINTCTVTPVTIDCVNRALSGEDYSQGALYFMNRGRSRSYNVGWFDGTLTYLFSHDGHEFFK